jgi:adenine deaminase
MPSRPTLELRERLRLGAVARGERAADLYLRGGSVLNVFTGEILPVNVAICGERIAYVGARDDMVGPRTRTLDVSGRVLVPGYIDPHVHPGNLVTPTSFARHVLPLGTTTVVGDTLQFWQLGGSRAVRAAADALAGSPLKFFWMLRVHGQSRAGDERRRFPLGELTRTLGHPWVLAIGEVTRWPDAHRGDRELLRRLDLALSRGRRVEGHTAGASAEKIPAIAVAGMTSDHEPITAKEVLERARQGIAVMLRESSLRPDLRGLLGALKEAPALASRLMLTADGSMPAFVRDHGFVDNLLRLAMAGGVAPIDAYRMATLNPATYYNLEAHVGSIAPGRFADVCVLPDLAEPRPAMVLARGRVVAEGGKLTGRVPEPAWRRIFTSPVARLAGSWRARPDDFALPPRARYPVLHLVSAVISRLEERPLMDGDLHAALFDRAGRWVAPGVVSGFAPRLDGLAATISTDFNIVVLGRNPSSMAHAVNRVKRLGGGIVIVDGDRVTYEMPLPVAGLMSPRSLPEVAAREEELRAVLVARGYPHHEPVFTLFFLAADFLPAVRLSPRGVWDVRRGRVLMASRRR